MPFNNLQIWEKEAQSGEEVEEDSQLEKAWNQQTKLGSTNLTYLEARESLVALATDTKFLAQVNQKIII